VYIYRQAIVRRRFPKSSYSNGCGTKFRHRGHRVAIWGSDLVSCQAALSNIQCPMDVEQKFSHREHRGHRVAIWGSDLVSCQAALSKIQIFQWMWNKNLATENTEDTELQSGKVI